jgi:UDP-N-acetylglucosamine:LPS N-acetylglucosamine transferase
MVARLSDWLYNPDHLKEASMASKRLAQPQATHRIVELIVEQLEKSAPDKLKIA